METWFRPYRLIIWIERLSGGRSSGTCGLQTSFEVCRQCFRSSDATQYYKRTSVWFTVSVLCTLIHRSPRIVTSIVTDIRAMTLFTTGGTNPRELCSGSNGRRGHGLPVVRRRHTTTTSSRTFRSAARNREFDRFSFRESRDNVFPCANASDSPGRAHTSYGTRLAGDRSQRRRDGASGGYGSIGRRARAHACIAIRYLMFNSFVTQPSRFPGTFPAA